MIRPRPPSFRRDWTVEEDNKLLRMKRNGRTAVQIAGVLQRSVASIKGRLNTRWRREPDLPPKRKPVVFIRHAEVEAWYLLGWRMIAINGNLITAQWQNEREPRWPDGYQAEAA